MADYSSPVADTFTVKLPPPHQPDEDVSDSAPEFLTKSEIEDLAVRLAMNGIGLDDGLLHFERAREIKLTALEEECRSRKAILSTWIAQLTDSIEHSRKQINILNDKQDVLRHTKASINLAIQTLQLKKATIRLEMRVKQLEEEKRFFEDENRRLSEKEKQIRDKIVKEKESELEYAKGLHSTLLDIWNTDEAELNRRAEVLKSEQSKAESLLIAAEEKIGRLREFGISRTTAGFLVWVGYTAFAGVGSLIGSLLQQRQTDPKSADLLGNFVRGFAAFFGLSQGTIFSWRPFLALLSFVGVSLVFIIGVTVFSDALLRIFSPTWKRSSVQRERRNHLGKPARGWKEVVSLFTSGSDRLSLFTGKITRGDYLQLLAVTPYLGLAALILFLVSALGATIPFSSSSSNTSAAATITSASLGAIFTLLGTSACLLYATKVIEPRSERLIKRGVSDTGSWTYIRLSWEFALLLLVMIVVLIFLTFLPLGDRNNYWAWGLAALFMTCGSVGLAYGLMYKGIFRDYDALNRRHQEYLIKIEEFILKPTLNDVFEATEPDELKEAANKYRKASEYLDGLRIEHELSELFTDYHSDYDSDFSRFWFNENDSARSRGEVLDLANRPSRKLARLIRRLWWRRRVPDMPVAWLRVSPDGIEQLKAHDEQIVGYEQQLKDMDGQLGQLDRVRIAEESNVANCRKDLRDYEVRLWAAETNCAQKLRDYNLQRERDDTIFTSAFLTGKMVSEYLAVNPKQQPRAEETQL